MCFYIPVAESYFGVEGIFPYENYIEQMKYYGFLIYPFSIPYLSKIFLLAVILFATMYLFAIWGRISGILLFLSLIILKLRNGFILDGSDNVIQVILPFLILSDNLNYFRYFERKKLTLISKLLSRYSIIFTYGFMLQVCYVYFFTALAKHEGELWRNGTATYYTMRVRDFMATDWNITLTENHYFVIVTTYFTLLWEFAFPFLIWFKKTKFYIMIGGIFLHIGIWVFMRIDNFSWVMISTYFAFITNQEYLKIGQYIKSSLDKANFHQLKSILK